MIAENMSIYLQDLILTDNKSSLLHTIFILRGIVPMLFILNIILLCRMHIAYDAVIKEKAYYIFVGIIFTLTFSFYILSFCLSVLYCISILVLDIIILSLLLLSLVTKYI